MGAGAITSVGKGSSTPARMIILEYPGSGDGQKQKPVVLVGKAITFDTGGYSLKDVNAIRTMKFDKSGGMVVLGVLKAAAELRLKTPLVGIICAAENMISGGAYRPDDIINSLSGKTIEIVTTDAEGRLVLADGLTYAQRYFQPRSLIDIATLTGGIVTALGKFRAGLFSNDDALAEQLFAAGVASHERLWRMPLDDDYFVNMKGVYADIKNSGGRDGAPIYGALFLKQFIEEGTSWAHLDIAGVAENLIEEYYIPIGATGFGVRLLLQYLESLE
jgi:leucyl aminopeptidase